MEALGSLSSVLTPVCRQFRSYKNAKTLHKSSHFNSTMPIDLCIKNILTLYFSKIPKTCFPQQMLPSSFLAGPAPPQKLCSKCTEIKTQKSVVISQFEITIIQINYNYFYLSIS